MFKWILADRRASRWPLPLLSFANRVGDRYPAFERRTLAEDDATAVGSETT
jgi:hypothetical protein